MPKLHASVLLLTATLVVAAPAVATEVTLGIGDLTVMQKMVGTAPDAFARAYTGRRFTGRLALIEIDHENDGRAIILGRNGGEMTCKVAAGAPFPALSRAANGDEVTITGIISGYADGRPLLSPCGLAAPLDEPR